MRQLVAIVLTLTLATSAFAQGLAGIPPQRTSAVKNSFQELTSHLDPGGNLYLYVSTEEVLKGLSGQIAQWRALFENIPDMSPEDRESMTRVFDVIASLVQNSGVEEVSGFGLSSLPIEKELYRVKSMLHHYKGNDRGFLWSLLGKKAHTLDSLDMMPSSAALAWSSDLDLPLLWSVLNDEIGKSGIPGAKEVLQGLPSAFKDMTGAELDAVLGSLGGEYGIAVTLDDTRMMTLPSPTGTIQIPEIGGIAMIRTRNDTVFNLIDQVVGSDPQFFKTDRSGFRMRTLTMQADSPLRPAIAQSGDYLMLASNSALIEEAVAVKAGQRPGLKSTEEFKRFSQGIPAQGNSFSYVSPRVGEALSRFQTQVLENSGTDPAERQLYSAMFGAGSGGSFGVGATSDEGWISVANTTQNPANIIMLPLVAVPLVVSSIAIPSLLRSRQAANESAAIANLRTINTAQVVYFAQSNKYGDMTTLIREGLLDTRFMTAVSGYTFDIDVSLKDDYLARATPVNPNTGRYGFYSTADGVVRYSLDPDLAPDGEDGEPVDVLPSRRGIVRNEGNDSNGRLVALPR